MDRHPMLNLKLVERIRSAAAMCISRQIVPRSRGVVAAFVLVLALLLQKLTM